MITLKRISDNGEATIGELWIDGQFECFTLEDQWQHAKIMGETRIPAGTYGLKKRLFGRFYNAYKKRWNHKFVPELVDVPGFTDILIHTGNTDRHTAGCLLVGSGYTDHKLTGSRDAYERLYKKLAEMMEFQCIMIKIEDEIPNEHS